MLLSVPTGIPFVKTLAMKTSAWLVNSAILETDLDD